MSQRLGSFGEFWPYYVSQHRHPANRALHFLGTSLALAALASALLLGPLWLLALPLAGYGPAWVGHLFFERNKPATFQYPLWSLLADFRMYGLTWAGRMAGEVERRPPA
ncbi:MAG: Mpo1-like protein [Betaproteobacteria bacterium]